MISYSRQSVNEEDIQSVIETLKSDFLTSGTKVEKFEKELATYLDVKYVCVMNSATSALHVAYKSIDLEVNDEIITSPITFAATSNAALMCDAKVVFCDVKSNGNINEEKIQSLITKKTKAIVPVDFGGNPVEINKIRDICDNNNLLLIQDCAHALGSEINGNKVGSMADIAIFSFHAIKPITTCGEGGAIATNDRRLYEKAKLIISHAIVKKEGWESDMEELGYNYRLNEVSCAMGLSQLKRLDAFIDKRAKIASYYNKRFKNNAYFCPIEIPLHVRSSHHLYPILLNQNLWSTKERIFKQLHKKNIGVQVHYKPLYKYSYYKKLFGNMALNKCEEFYKSELSLPCHQDMSFDDAKYVADTFFEILNNIVPIDFDEIKL